MRRFLSVLLLAVSGAAIGCGSDNDGDDSDSGGPTGQSVAPEDFPARFASAWCGLLAGCCDESGGTPEGSCETDLQSELTLRGSRAEADGATWNQAAASRCLDAVEAADCSGRDPALLRALLDDCEDTWDGVVPPGGACQYHESCAEPPVSGGASAGASCVNSMCVQVVRLPPGATCDEADTLMACDPFAAECVSGTCQALPAAGDDCTDDCTPGSSCTDGTCVALLGAGEACADDGECASDQCNAGQCASAFVESDYCALP